MLIHRCSFILVWCKTPWGWCKEYRNMSKSWWNVRESVFLILVHLLVFTFKMSVFICP